MLQWQKRFGKIKIFQFLLLSVAKKSGFSDSFWPIPLTISTHRPWFPPRGAKLLEFTSKKPKLLFRSHHGSDILILLKTFFPEPFAEHRTRHK